MTVRDPWVGHRVVEGSVFHPLSVYSWATDPDHPANKPSCPSCGAGIPVVKKRIVSGINEDNELVQLQMSDAAYQSILWAAIQISIKQKQRTFRVRKSLQTYRTRRTVR